MSLRLIERRLRQTTLVPVRGTTMYLERAEQEIAGVSLPELRGRLEPAEERSGAGVLPVRGAAPGAQAGSVNVQHLVVAEVQVASGQVITKRHQVTVVAGLSYDAGRFGTATTDRNGPVQLFLVLDSLRVTRNHNVEGRAHLRGVDGVPAGDLDLYLERTKSWVVHNDRLARQDLRSATKQFSGVRLDVPAVPPAGLAELPFSLRVPLGGNITTSTIEGSLSWRVVGMWRARQGDGEATCAVDFLVALLTPASGSQSDGV